MRRRKTVRALGLGAAAISVLLVPAPPADAATGELSALQPHDQLDDVVEVALASDGDLWFLRRWELLHRDATTTAVTNHQPPDQLLYPRAITAGVEGDVWFGSAYDAGIGHLDASGAATYFVDDEVDELHVSGLAVGPDGTVYFPADRGLGRLDPDEEQPDDAITVVDVSACPQGVDDLVPDAAGRLWARCRTGALGRATGFVRITDPSGAATSTAFATSTAEFASSPIIGPDGQLWYGSEVHGAGGVVRSITRLSLATGATTSFRLPEVLPFRLVSGDDDNVWFVVGVSQSTGSWSNIGYVSTTGVVKVYDEYSDVVYPTDAVIGADGDLVFTGFGEPDHGAYVFDTPHQRFRDVTSRNPFFTEVDFVAEEGIGGGYDDDTFRTTAPVSRQAMSAFLHRFAGSPDFTPPVQPTFTDVSSGHPFFTEIEWLVAEEIASGFPDDTFRPATPVSRGATSAFLCRLFRQSEG